MEQSFYLFASLAIGLLVGASAVWLILRARILAAAVQAKGENQIDMARLNERLIASQQDVTRLTTEHVDLQKQATLWRDQLDASRDERAQLVERVARLPEMQSVIEAADITIQNLKQTLGDLREKLGAAESTVTNQVEQLAILQREKESLAALRDQLIAEQQRLSTQVAELTTTLESERSQTEEKLELLKNAEEQLSNRFKTLASEILDEKSKKFTDQNKTNLDQLLEPLKVKITEFQGKVHVTLPLNSVSLNALIMRHPSTAPQTSFSRTALG